MKKVSVIVPVYNAEKTAARLIESILNQTYINFELILCDDGSSDDSLNICRHFEDRDSRITVLSLPHKGVSAARNAGLDAASGQYIAFADSDDITKPGWLKDLIINMPLRGLSVCGYNCLNSEGEILYDSAKNDAAQMKDITIAPSVFTSDIFSNRHMYQGYIWNKLFDRELIGKAGTKALRFDERIYFNEDRLFLCLYLERCGSVSYSNLPLYNYSLNDAPAHYERKQLTEMLAFLIMFRNLKERGERDAMHHADVDARRAALELYNRVKAEKSSDAGWLKEYIYEHLGSFPTQSEEDEALEESLLLKL